MGFARILTVIGLAAGASGALLFQGCSSSTASPSTGGGATPPSAPDAPKTTSTTEHNFAMKTLLIGDATRAGQSSPTAWKDFGYNLDGKTSTKSSTDVCKPPGNTNSAKEDGTNGIDNAFGSIILPFIQSVAGNDIAAKVNQAISDGTFTIMIDVTGLTDDPAQTNTGLTGFLNAGDTFSDTQKPTFTTADDWPVLPQLLSNAADPKSSTVRFSNAFVTNGLFVNGSQSDVRVSLVFSGQAIDLTIHRAIVSFQHKGAVADKGTIAGVLDTEELITNLRVIAGRLSTSLCSGGTLDNLLQGIRGASDIMKDGTQNPSATCDGISIGLGFQGAEIGLPQKVGAADAPSPDPCTSDAGAD